MPRTMHEISPSQLAACDRFPHVSNVYRAKRNLPDPLHRGSILQHVRENGKRPGRRKKPTTSIHPDARKSDRTRVQ